MSERLRQQIEDPARSFQEAEVNTMLRTAAELEETYTKKELLAIIAACLMQRLSRGL